MKDENSDQRRYIDIQASEKKLPFQRNLDSFEGDLRSRLTQDLYCRLA